MFYLHNNKLLISNGSLAISNLCCCCAQGKDSCVLVKWDDAKNMIDFSKLKVTIDVNYFGKGNLTWNESEFRPVYGLYNVYDAPSKWLEDYPDQNGQGPGFLAGGYQPPSSNCPGGSSGFLISVWMNTLFLPCYNYCCNAQGEVEYSCSTLGSIHKDTILASFSGGYMDIIAGETAYWAKGKTQVVGDGIPSDTYIMGKGKDENNIDHLLISNAVYGTNKVVQLITIDTENPSYDSWMKGTRYGILTHGGYGGAICDIATEPGCYGSFTVTTEYNP